MSGRRSERGAASLMVVACLALLLMVGSALGVVTAMVAAQRSAQSAADLAAIAAATAAQRGSPACPAADQVAVANGAALELCIVDGGDVRVTVVVTGPRLLGQVGDLRGQARAGPA